MDVTKRKQVGRRTATEQLATYLNDHLAGSLAGLELVTYIETGGFGDDLADIAAGLKREIATDRQILEELIEDLGFTRNPSRQVATWVMEKGAELKARWDDPSDGTLRLLEILEALALGIAGKQALWRALRSVDDGPAPLKQLDYSRLLQRARDQHARVESLRLMAAQRAFSPPPNAAVKDTHREDRTTGSTTRIGGPIERRGLAVAQGAYFLATGVWPLVHMRSFEAVTGPKVDKWLVRTVGVLVSVIGGTLLIAGKRRRVNGDTVRLGVGAAAGLGAIDVRYAATGRISRIYLADAVLEACFAAAWQLAGKGRRARPAHV